MKTLTELLLLTGLLVLAYLCWLNQQQIMELADSQIALEQRVGALSKTPARKPAARAPRKETTQ